MAVPRWDWLSWACLARVLPCSHININHKEVLLNFTSGLWTTETLGINTQSQLFQ